MKTVDIEIVQPTRRYPNKGMVVTAEVDRNGVIKDRFLRRRLRDSDIDGNCKIKQAAKKATPKTEDKLNAV